jgi:tetratricopeptide (TPR) repeat protein
LCTTLVWALWSWNARRAEEQRAALVVTAAREFRARLEGARAAQVDAVADEIQEEYDLAGEERARLLEGAAGVIATLPREITSELERSLVGLLRGLYRDLRLDPQEEAQLRAFRVEQRLDEADVAAVERRLLDRLEPAAEHLQLGRTLVERRMFAEAEGEYRQAIEIDPADPLAWAQLGAMLAVLNRSDEAFSCYQRALELDSRSWLTHYNLAVWHARRGEASEALARIEATLTSVPDAVPERSAVVQALLEEPAFASLRGDPRFAHLLSLPAGGESGAKR